MPDFSATSIDPYRAFTFPQTLRLATLAAQIDQPDDVGLQTDSTYKLYEWNRLKSEVLQTPINLSQLMASVEQQVVAEKGSLIGNANELFKQFAERLRPPFQATCHSGEIMRTSQLHCAALQARVQKRYENEALSIIWNRELYRQFAGLGAFRESARPVGLASIRRWLNDPANAAWIHEVRSLNLTDLNLKALPSEIGLFGALQSLSLSNNNLSSLPESIGKLSSLTSLFLNRNQIRYLPDAFGELQALTVLSLDRNELRSWPESIGKLGSLTELYLGRNDLSYLPESIGDLGSLTNLYLECNQLFSLPESIGNLKALISLDLQSNRLNFLPKSIESLNEKIFLRLEMNPWMLGSNAESAKIRDYQTYAVFLEPLRKYTPQSPLAALFRAIFCNDSVPCIQKIYAELPLEMQVKIKSLLVPSSTIAPQTPTFSSAASSSSSSSIESDVNLFVDMGFFARAVRTATYNRYYSLEPDQKNLVHWHIWDLAGRPESEEQNWGETHLFDHTLRFTDALARATLD